MPNPNVRKSPITPRYGYNQIAERYIDQRTGRFVPQARITSIVNRQITHSRKEMLNLSEQLKSGNIDYIEWRAGMLKQIKTVHVANAVAAKGGWAQMTPADWGRAGGKLRYQIERLDRLASQVQYGTQPLDGRFTQRVQMYANAGRATYEATRGQVADDWGADQEQNVLGQAEHCDECLAETARGWVPLGMLSPIGSRKCKTNDQCHKRYRNSKTGKLFE